MTKEIEDAILTLEVLIDECKENGSNNAQKEWDAIEVFRKVAFENTKLKNKNSDLKQKLKDEKMLSNDRAKDRDKLLDMFLKNREYYNKALELLCEYQIPCEIDDFMNKNTDYCSRNCSVDDEVSKKCWNRFIEQELEKRG